MRVPSKTWRFVFERDGAICQYCDADLLANLSSYWSSTVDHVRAVSAGGSDEAQNLVACCPACNSMLSRSEHLMTVAERKTFVAIRREQELLGYGQWVAELREKTE